jgi:hypothetical protein
MGMSKYADDLAAQMKGNTEELRYLELRRQLEERAGQENLTKVYVAREEYEKLDADKIREMEEEIRCVFIPAGEDEIRRMKDDTVPYVMPPEIPDIKMLTPEVLPHVKGGRYHEPPRDLRKRKKSKRRQQKQSRRNR